MLQRVVYEFGITRFFTKAKVKFSTAEIAFSLYVHRRKFIADREDVCFQRIIYKIIREKKQSRLQAISSNFSN